MKTLQHTSSAWNKDSANFALLGTKAGASLVHLQNRFRVVRYSSSHESSNLCTFVFG